MFRAEIKVRLKAGVLDPQGKAVQGSLATMGFASENVRVGKLIELTVNAATQAAAEQLIDAMCRKLLANPIIEAYTFTVTPGVA